MSSYKSQKRYIQNYRESWEMMAEFKSWLKPFPNDRTKAYCDICNTIVKAHLCDLRKHGAAKKHKKSILLLNTLKHLKNNEEQEDPLTQLDISEDEDCEEEEEAVDINEKWTIPAVDCLLRQLKIYWNDLKDGLKKKKDIFEEIAAAMLEEGFSFQGDECGKKFRNIKLRYFNVLEKTMHGKTVKHRIHYFEDLHQLMRYEPETKAYLNQRKIVLKSDTHFNSTVEEEQDISLHSSQYELGIDGDLDWTDAATNQLLDLIQEFQDVFSENEDNKKYPIWQMLSKHMNQEGYPVDRVKCNRKWNDMVDKYNNYKAEAEKTGTLPLWPFYTRVRHITSVVKFPTDLVFEKMPRKLTKKRTPYRRLQRKHHQEPETQASESEDYESIDTAGNHQTNRYVKRLGQNAEVWERLNDIENRLNFISDQQEQQNRTNNLLVQILTELSTLSSHIAPKNSQLREGITLVVPQTDD